MKTAVEWLYEQILLTPLDIRSINKCLEQAKEMEKQQIVNAWFGGYLNGEIKSELKSEQYYNETYKTKTIVTEFRDGSVKVENFKSE
jgi:hypothetical protein